MLVLTPKTVHSPAGIPGGSRCGDLVYDINSKSLVPLILAVYTTDLPRLASPWLAFPYLLPTYIPTTHTIHVLLTCPIILALPTYYSTHTTGRYFTLLYLHYLTLCVPRSFIRPSISCHAIYSSASSIAGHPRGLPAQSLSLLAYSVGLPVYICPSIIPVPACCVLCGFLLSSLPTYYLPTYTYPGCPGSRRI